MEKFTSILCLFVLFTAKKHHGRDAIFNKEVSAAGRRPGEPLFRRGGARHGVEAGVKGAVEGAEVPVGRQGHGPADLRTGDCLLWVRDVVRDDPDPGAGPFGAGGRLGALAVERRRAPHRAGERAVGSDAAQRLRTAGVPAPRGQEFLAKGARRRRADRI